LLVFFEVKNLEEERMFQRIRIISLFLLAAVPLLVFFASCGSASGNSKTIGLSLSSMDNSFFTNLDKGVKTEAAKDNYNVIDNNANNDASTQVSQIENMITRKVDVLIINPVSSQGISPVVQQANSAGIPVITLDRSSDSGNVASFVQSNSVAMAQQAADWIAQQLHARYGSYKGNVVDLEGQPGTSSAQDRENGFKQELQKYPGINVVATQAADFNQETAYNVMSNVLQGHSQIDAVFGANDDTSVGAVKAIQAAHRYVSPGSSNHIFVIGIDGTPQALSQINDHNGVDASVAQNSLGMGEKAVDLAAEHFANKSVSSLVYFPDLLITAQNINSQAVKNFGISFN
jgi:ribose transport system substrate-binding protein